MTLTELSEQIAATIAEAYAQGWDPAVTPVQHAGTSPSGEGTCYFDVETVHLNYVGPVAERKVLVVLSPEEG